LRDVDELDVQLEENEKVYRYAVQYLGRSNGKDVLERCYLGPQEHVHATSTHKDLGLTLRSLVGSKKMVEYLNSLNSLLTVLLKVKVDERTLTKLVKELELVLEVLEEKAESCSPLLKSEAFGRYSASSLISLSCSPCSPRSPRCTQR